MADINGLINALSLHGSLELMVNQDSNIDFCFINVTASKADMDAIVSTYLPDYIVDSLLEDGRYKASTVNQ